MHSDKKESDSKLCQPELVEGRHSLIVYFARLNMTIKLCQPELVEGRQTQYDNQTDF
jgi:hypothetical protein